MRTTSARCRTTFCITCCRRCPRTTRCARAFWQSAGATCGSPRAPCGSIHARAAAT
ncbi:hypothetical protein PR202_ga24604 [Eleusine coracana subsp. coracana]|uniref:Uncharacterized protein n=1 Tax=Eleusine coracana subsp. coracana TaxID=191504 RepID=A0AAV5D9Y4_ELECO|nr:hypothetical protein PR202_ga24604 [Eleusine coracana subsp. coracana]